MNSIIEYNKSILDGTLLNQNRWIEFGRNSFYHIPIGEEYNIRLTLKDSTEVNSFLDNINSVGDPFFTLYFVNKETNKPIDIRDIKSYYIESDIEENE